MTEPGPSPDECPIVIGRPGASESRKDPTCGWWASRPSTSPRSAASSPHARSRKARRPSADPISRASRKVPLTRSVRRSMAAPATTGVGYETVREGGGEAAKKMWHRPRARPGSAFGGRVVREFAVQPGAGEGPVPLGGAEWEAQGGGRLFHRQSGEVTQLHQPRRNRLDFPEPCQNAVEVQQSIRSPVRWGMGLVEFDALPAAPVLRGLLAADLLDEDAAHGLGGRGEEMPPAVPVLLVPTADE